MRLLVTLVPLLCTGCVAAWGGSYHVAAANSNAVTVEFDPAVVNLPSVLRAAQSECEKFNRDAVLNSTSSGNLGIVVNTYRCEPKIEASN